MALDEQSIALRAMEAAGLDETALPRIVSLIPTAREVMARRIASGPDYRELQKDFDAAPSSGVYDTATVPTMLFRLERSQVRVASTGATLQAVDNLRTLDKGGLPSDVVYYTADGDRLVFRSTTPAINDYSTAVKIRANFIPTLAEAETYGFDGTLVATLAEMLGAVKLEAAA